ncbi:MAG: tetratricopeptide repeat protein [Tannerellaceae bacterium]|jgi:tetratricopeptide (TPR) repeat protein|nr:tetratricopeptide repeat protein [Tannerellaceae bacterium]
MGNFFKSLFSSSEAETSVDEQTKENRKKFDVFKYDGIRALRMGKVSYGVQCFEEALKIEEDIEVLQFLATAYAALHALDEALRVTHRLVELKPEDVNVLLARASLFNQAEKGEEAIADCLRVVALDASNPVAWYLMGKVKKSGNDLSGAIDDLTKAIDIKQDFVDACLLRAEILLELNRSDEALLEMEDLIDLAPEEEAVYLLRGRVNEHLGNLSAAADDYGQVVILNPFNEEASLLKGALLMKEGKWEEAVDFFDEVIELIPSFSEAYRGRAKAKASKGDNEGAWEDEQKAVALDAERKEDEEVGGSKRPNFNDMYKGGIF